jgi:hypothetical protein
MKAYLSLLLIVCLAFLSCKNKGKDKIITKVEEVTLSDPSEPPPPPPPSPPSGLKVTAHLVFDDSTLSTFDVLNDKTIALWNTIIGGGDVPKPSHNTKVNFFGDLDSLEIRIKNGRNLVVNKIIDRFRGEFEFFIPNTGCAEVYVKVSKRNKVLYNDTIPFHCGE